MPKKGEKRSKETRAKISAKLTGRKGGVPWNKGRKMPLEEWAHLSAVMKGKKLSEEH